MRTASAKASPVSESRQSHARAIFVFTSRMSRSDGWKLASYEVAGGGGENEFVLAARRKERKCRRPVRTQGLVGTMSSHLVAG